MPSQTDQPIAENLATQLKNRPTAEQAAKGGILVENQIVCNQKALFFDWFLLFCIIFLQICLQNCNCFQTNVACPMNSIHNSCGFCVHI